MPDMYGNSWEGNEHISYMRKIKMPQVNKQEKREYKKVVVEGLAMYASVHKPKKPFTEGMIPAYTLDLVVTDDQAKILEDEGLSVATKKSLETVRGREVEVFLPREYPEYPGQKVFRLTRKTHKKGEAPGMFGEARSPLVVNDSQNNPIPSNILLGNGSKVRVVVNPWTFNVKGKDITGHDLLEVQVLELVPYEGSGKQGPNLEPVKGGFTVNSVNDSLATKAHSDEDPFEDS